VNVVESLIAAGAFDELAEDAAEGHDRAWLLTNARIIKANTKLKKKQHPMAEELLSKQEVMEKERELLGFFISMDPFEDIRDTVSQYPAESVLMGTVNAIRTKIDKNGNKMAFLTVDHPDLGRCSATVFSSVWTNCHNVTRGKIVVMQGKNEEWNGRSSFKVDKVMAIY
jgi:DNA polymerase III alpha subunit